MTLRNVQRVKTTLALVSAAALGAFLLAGATSAAATPPDVQLRTAGSIKAKPGKLTRPAPDLGTFTFLGVPRDIDVTNATAIPVDVRYRCSPEVYTDENGAQQTMPYALIDGSLAGGYGLVMHATGMGARCDRLDHTAMLLFTRWYVPDHVIPPGGEPATFYLRGQYSRAGGAATSIELHVTVH